MQALAIRSKRCVSRMGIVGNRHPGCLHEDNAKAGVTQGMARMPRRDSLPGKGRGPELVPFKPFPQPRFSYFRGEVVVRIRRTSGRARSPVGNLISPTGLIAPRETGELKWAALENFLGVFYWNVPVDQAANWDCLRRHARTAHAPTGVGEARNLLPPEAAASYLIAARMSFLPLCPRCQSWVRGLCC